MGVRRGDVTLLDATGQWEGGLKIIDFSGRREWPQTALLPLMLCMIRLMPVTKHQVPKFKVILISDLNVNSNYNFNGVVPLYFGLESFYYLTFIHTKKMYYLT